jgi:hypothetical protein
MKVYLAMMFLVQGQWIDGATLDGWAPREQPSMEMCLDRARKAMTDPPPEGVEWLSANCQVVVETDRLGCTNPDLAGLSHVESADPGSLAVARRPG